MFFNEVQAKKLRENRDAIIAWIHGNVIAPLTEEGVYGAVEVRGFYGETHKLFKLKVTSKGNIEYSVLFSRNISLFDTDNCDVYGDELYLMQSNWSDIKRKLLNEMETRKQRSEVINNFVV